MKTLRLFLALQALTLIVVPHLLAEFGVTIRTSISDSVSTATVRLYNLGAPSGPGVDPSEIGDPVWLVIDVDGDGVFKKSSGGSGTVPDTSYSIPSGTADAFQSAVIDPDDHVERLAIVAPIEGRAILVRTGLPSTLQTGGVGANNAGGTVKPAYALLFRSSDFSAGGSFGFDLTAAGGPIPQAGNVDLRIGQDVYADAFTFTVGGVQPPAQPAITNVTAQVSQDGSTVAFGFSFFAESGASYTLLSTTNLADKPIAWAPEGAPLLGANTQTNLTATNSIPPFQKYYRLETRRP